MTGAEIKVGDTFVVRGKYDTRSDSFSQSQNYDLVSIERREDIDLAGTTMTFFSGRFHIADRPAKLPKRLPSYRDLVDASEVDELFEHLAQPFDTSSLASTWNRRLRELDRGFLDGGIFALADVYRALRAMPTLSFGEQKMCDRALAALSHELAIVLGEPVDTMRERVTATASG